MCGCNRQEGYSAVEMNRCSIRTQQRQLEQYCPQYWQQCRQQYPQQYWYHTIINNNIIITNSITKNVLEIEFVYTFIVYSVVIKGLTSLYYKILLHCNTRYYDKKRISIHIKVHYQFNPLTKIGCLLPSFHSKCILYVINTKTFQTNSYSPIPTFIYGSLSFFGVFNNNNR